MAEKLKCPYCGSKNLLRMDGYGSMSKYCRDVMLDIAPDIILCKDCQKEFRDLSFDDLTVDKALWKQKGK